MKKILIAIGHGKSKNGGYDPGACAQGQQEFKIAKEIGKAIKDTLAVYDCDAELLNYDAKFNLKERISYSNKSTYDLVLEIHLNAGKGFGVEVYHSIGDNVGKDIASKICENISYSLNVKNRGAKIRPDSSGNDYFGIIRETKATALLIETCFIDTSDVQKVIASNGQTIAGQAIANAVVSKLGISKAVVVPKPQKQGKWCIGNFNENTKNRADVKVHLDALKKIGYGVWYEEAK